MTELLLFLKNPINAYYFSALLMVWPVGRIFIRAGFSAGYTAYLLVPAMGHIICLGVLTFKSWPVWQGKDAGAKA